MLSYKDMTFCHSDCVNTDCFRNWTPEKQANADAWWGKPNPPIAFADFSKNCDQYLPKKGGTA